MVEGVCLGFELFFEIDEIKAGYGTWSFFSFSVLPVIIFVYCYGHIVVVMKKQMRVMAGHNVEGAAQSASHAQSKRIKWNIIKTMIIVSDVSPWPWSLTPKIQVLDTSSPWHWPWPCDLSPWP